MNSLSWLIYFADIVSSLTVVFILLGCAIFVVGLVLWIQGECKKDAVPKNYRYYSKEEESKQQEIMAVHPMYLLGHRQQLSAYLLVPLVAFCLLFAVAIPSSKAVYMIAASELGESAYTQFANSDLYKSLRKILENELGQLLPEEKPKTTPPAATPSGSERQDL